MSKRLLHLMGRGGTDFPGKVARVFDPEALKHVSKGVKCIIVAGTNGKTTTARMIEQALSDLGVSYFSNKAGANLITGITAEFINNCDMSGHCTKEYALIECDEAAFKEVSKQLDARVILVTNLFRDQLDRYGEVTHTLRLIEEGIKNSPNATLCLNADDSLVASIAGDFPNLPVVFYGVNTPIYKTRVDEVSDAPFCIRCKHKYVYDYVTYAHLGSYHCPNCGYERPTPDIAVTKVLSTDANQSKIEMSDGEKTYDATVNLPGGYNIYNACGTMAVGKALGWSMDAFAKSLSEFAPGFGRMEKFMLNGTSVQMILAKNPAGCNQVINFVGNISGNFAFVICLNDRAADGTDISWIWDVGYERMADFMDRVSCLYLSGSRAEDLAVRMKYADIPSDKIKIIKNFEDLVTDFTNQDDPVYIMPTFTAMMDLREQITKMFPVKEFWE